MHYKTLILPQEIETFSLPNLRGKWKNEEIFVETGFSSLIYGEEGVQFFHFFQHSYFCTWLLGLLFRN